MRILRPAVLAVVLAAAASFAGAGPVAAQDPPPDVDDVGNTVVVTDTSGVPLGAEPPTGSTGSGPGGPPPTYSVDFFDGVAPEDGTFEYDDGCWGIAIAEGSGGSTWAEAQATLTEYNDAQAWGACAAAETFDLTAYVLQSWRSVVRPPPPSPLEVAPGRAVTGLRAYLEIGGDPAPTTTLANPIGPDVVITMTPRYVVGWGDGTSVETDSQGVPWPGGAGEISHVFTEAEDVTVTVDAYWRATWTAGGAGGSLPELPAPTSASLDLPVEQYQARTD